MHSTHRVHGGLLGSACAFGRALAGLLAVSVWALHARAATLEFEAPRGCDTEADVREQVTALAHQELAAVPKLAFAMRISVDAQGLWRLTLLTRSDDDERVRSRTLTGANCAEVSSAAAVAIAMAIEESTAPTLELQPEPAAVSDAVAKDVLVTERPAPVPSKDATAGQLRLAVGAGLILDVGLLPATGVGAQVEVSARWSNFQVLAWGALFASQRSQSGPAGQGGEFGLGLGAIVACVDRRIAALGVGLCPGFELGSLSAEGVGVGSPHASSQLVYGPRVEMRAVFRFGPEIASFARVGATFNARRDRFVLNDDRLDDVHRPAAVSLRVGAGVEFSL